MNLIALMLLALQDPLPPAEALRSLRIQPGYKIELVAHEPEIMDPVALAFDSDRRLWIVEMGDYPLGPAPGGRIKILHEGRVTLFADRLPYPTSVLPWKGGAIVTAAPDILFLKDTDGDGRADERRVLYTGFPQANTQLRVNALRYGLDNWIYGSGGRSGGRVKDVNLKGLDFRFHPVTQAFEAIAGHSQWAMAFDDAGRRFINMNANHVIHPALPLAYVRRNPHAAVAAVEEGISDHGDAARIFPLTQRERFFSEMHRRNEGHFTSACALTIWRGEAFACEPVHNLVHRDRIEPRGASFRARRVDENAEFIASTDVWFRPVYLCPGPDGALYLADFYRPVVEHPEWVPAQAKKELEPRLRTGHDLGRLYRIVSDAPVPAPPADDLLAQIESANPWWRYRAQQIIVDRQDRTQVEGLRKMRTPAGRIHALWTLEGLGALEAADVEAALRDADPGVRENALLLAEPRLQTLRGVVKALSADPDPRVRFQLALTAGLLKDDDVLAAILARDAGDRWTRTAVLLSLADPARFIDRLPAELFGKAGSVEFFRALGAVVAARKDTGEMEDFVGRVALGDVPDPWKLAALLGARQARKGAGWVRSLRKTALDSSLDAGERVDAIDFLAAISETDTLEKLLRPQEPAEIQAAAVRALATGPDLRFLEGWAGRTGIVRREIMKALFARADRLPRVLEAIEKGELRAVELDLQYRKRLLEHPDAAFRERAKKLLEVSTDREEVVREVTAKVIPLGGDAVRGRKVFSTNCASCHRLGGEGSGVGPDLATMTGRTRQELLREILDPNRAVDPAYQVYLVKTAAGDLSGVVSSETPTSLTLRRAMGEESTILRKEILDLRAWPASLMPDGVENNIAAQDFADLLEFLKGGSR